MTAEDTIMDYLPHPLTFECRECEETEEWVSRLAAKLHGWADLHQIDALWYDGKCPKCERDERAESMGWQV